MLALASSIVLKRKDKIFQCTLQNIQINPRNSKVVYSDKHLKASQKTSEFYEHLCVTYSLVFNFPLLVTSSVTFLFSSGAFNKSDFYARAPLLSGRTFPPDKLIIFSVHFYDQRNVYNKMDRVILQEPKHMVLAMS